MQWHILCDSAHVKLNFSQICACKIFQNFFSSIAFNITHQVCHFCSTLELVQGQYLRGRKEKSRLIWLAGFWTPSALFFAILLEILQKDASQPSSVQGSSSTCPISPGCSQPEGAQDKFQTSHAAAGLQHGIISSCQVLLSESLSLTLWHSSVTTDFTCCVSLFSCREQGWE